MDDQPAATCRPARRSARGGRSRRGRGAALGALLVAGLAPWAAAQAGSPPEAAAMPGPALDRCLDRAGLTRIARVVDPTGRVVYARVVETRGGHIARAATIAPDGTPLADVFDRAVRTSDAGAYAVDDARVCAAVALPERALDDETHVIVSTGLNYAAHAEEAGGGDIFLFPKPASPTPPYAPVHPDEDVVLLDYEVELAFVALEDLDPFAPPPRDALLDRIAFFLSNDVSDREPIVRHKALSGPGTGFAEGKGQPGFLPAGPWLVRGSELMAAVEACGATGLELELYIDDEADPRQQSTTGRMILDPHELVGRLGSWIDEHGRRSTMPFRRSPEDAPRGYPLAVPADAPKLTAGSIFQTGTPDGVALAAPSPLGVTLRGLVRGRGPFTQFLAEEKRRFAEGDTAYLVPGSAVRARIDGLGEQRFAIGERGTTAPPHPCDPPGPAPGAGGRR